MRALEITAAVLPTQFISLALKKDWLRVGAME